MDKIIIKKEDLGCYNIRKTINKNGYVLLNKLRKTAERKYEPDFTVDLSDNNIGLAYAITLLEQSKIGATDLNDRVDNLVREVTTQANKTPGDNKYKNMLIEVAEIWADYLN